MSLLTPDSGLLFWMILSFGIVLVILSKYGFPVIVKAIEERKAYIENSLETARKANEQLANIQKEGERILAEAKEKQNHILKEAMSEKEHIIDEGSTDIKDFISSVKENGGYYIARFEASEGEFNKAESKYGKTIVSNITQANASTACQDLYNGVNSDLMNSYAWDTAILFIQKYGLENYSRQTTLNSKLQKSGESGDIQCNIYDMSSNCYEWTTETYTKKTSTPCTDRGGGYDVSIFYTSIRAYTVINAYSHNSFRSILYL